MSTHDKLIRLQHAVERLEGDGLHQAMHYRQLPSRASFSVKLDAFQRDVYWYRIHTEDVAQKADNLIADLRP